MREEKMKLTLNGKYNTAIVMTDFVEPAAVGQIIALCSQEMFKDSQIRIMPDCHEGKGCIVGFTAQVKDKIVPNLIGVDIACSVSAYKLDAKDIDFAKLDAVIRQHIPSGMSFRKDMSKLVDNDFSNKIKKVCKEIGDLDDFGRHICSLGSLGGGNHFIEIDKQGDEFWLLIHCGSRNFGLKVCHYHQERADKAYNERLQALRDKASSYSDQERVGYLKSIDALKLPPDFRYLEGELFDKYVEHMTIAQEFATLNHKIIAHEICSRMGWKQVETIFTYHNYLEFVGNREVVVRKGAVSAKNGELLIIPLNMRDGSLICRGKGNPDWNCSAPHGAGRVLGRGDAKRDLSLDDFKETMKDVWTTSVSRGTLDESPMAYKDMSIILDCIGETVDIVGRITPAYNFKAV